MRLHVGPDEGGEHPVLLLQQSLRFVVFQNVPSLHHDDGVGREDGVDAVLGTESRSQEMDSCVWPRELKLQNKNKCLDSLIRVPNRR